MGLVDTLLDGFPEWEQLGPSEAERRRRWRAKLRSEQKQDELTAVRDSLRTGCPMGSPAWVEGVAARLGIDLTPRPRGRPREEEPASVIEARKMKKVVSGRPASARVEGHRAPRPAGYTLLHYPPLTPIIPPAEQPAIGRLLPSTRRRSCSTPR